MKALITGATSGIGREMAVILAKQGIDLIIASRDTKKMRQLAKRLPVDVKTITVKVPEGIKLEVPSNTELFVRGIDKQLVGEFAANVRKIRKPEPYKGKGIKYKDEHIRRKEGKKAA